MSLAYHLFKSPGKIVRRIFKSVLWCGPSDLAGVVLTFDDGPNISYTNSVLDILGRYGIPATFFVVGQRVEQYPEVVRRIGQEGHTIGNHTYSHMRLILRQAEIVKKEISQTEKAVEQICEIKTKYFRPPFGHFDRTAFNVATQLGYRIVMWSGLLADWREDSPERIVSQSRRYLSGGAILVFHDGLKNSGTTVKALDEVVRIGLDSGLEFVPLDGFIKLLGDT